MPSFLEETIKITNDRVQASNLSEREAEPLLIACHISIILREQISVFYAHYNQQISVFYSHYVQQIQIFLFFFLLGSSISFTDLSRKSIKSLALDAFSTVLATPSSS